MTILARVIVEIQASKERGHFEPPPVVQNFQKAQSE